MKITPKMMKNFLERLEKTDSCWIWKGSRDIEGYGRLNVLGGKSVKAHRLSWSIEKGDIPEGMVICHSCDNTSCVNPEHLFLGTHIENLRDRDNKLRMTHGEKTNTAKLKEAQVLEIRARYDNGETNKSALSREYGVSNPMIGLIVRRKNWKHLK